MKIAPRYKKVTGVKIVAILIFVIQQKQSHEKDLLSI